MADQENTFDSVQWARDGHQPDSPPTPGRSNGDRRRSSSHSASQRPADPNADEADLAGIGMSGFLDCTVSKPLKESDGTKDAFMSYMVTTNSDFKTFSRSKFSVRRRFTDFVYLYKFLFRSYAHVAVPPLPDKHAISYVRGDRFSPDFTERRAASLHRFLRRISMHPVLRRNPTFLLFLETPDWNAVMRGSGGGPGGRQRGASLSESAMPGGSPEILPGGMGGGGVGGSVSGNGSSAFESFQDWSMNLFSRPHKPDRRFVEVRERCDKLDEDLSHVDKVATRVARREGDLENDYADLAQQFRKLVNMEPRVGADIDAFAGGVEETGGGLRRLREATEREYLGSLRDMSAYVGSLRQLLRTREQKQLDFEALTDYLAKSAAERDSLAGQHGAPSLTSAPGNFLRSKIEDARGVDPESSRRNRLRAKEMEIERLTREVEEAKRTSESFDDQCVGECREFERIKGAEFRETMGGLCEAEMQFWSGLASTWETFLTVVENGEKVRMDDEDDEEQQSHGQGQSAQHGER